MNESLLGQDGWWDQQVDVIAPEHAVGYSPDKGWLFSLQDRVAALSETILVLDVEDGLLKDCAGPASLAQVARVDRELYSIRSAIIDMGEYMSTRMGDPEE